LDNFRAVFDHPLTSGAISTSLRSSALGVLFVLPIAYGVMSTIRAGAGHMVGRTAELIANLPLSVPASVFGAAIAYVYSRPPVVLYGTNWILVTAYVTLMLPFATRTLLTARIALGEQYVAASRTSGASALRTELQILLPLLRSALASAAGLTFVLMSHEFAASLIVRSRRTEVMGTRLFDMFSTSSYPVAAAMALVMVAVTALGLGLTVAVGGSGRRGSR
jgi:iron(III) transport system permease protein